MFGVVHWELPAGRSQVVDVVGFSPLLKRFLELPPPLKPPQELVAVVTE